MIFRVCVVILLPLSFWMVMVNSGDLETDQVDQDLSFSSVENVDVIGSESIIQEGRSKRLKRSSWSLPPNTSVRYIIEWIIPITPLNNSFAQMNYYTVFRFVLPTYTNLQSLYSTLGKLEFDKEDDGDSNVIDLEFLEEQRANDERRNVYLHVEDMFKNLGYDGHTCLLRAMCELAETPLAHHGLVGKLLDLIFTPSLLQVPKSMESYLKSNRIRRDVSTIPELEVLQRPLEDDYTDAYKAGKEGKCWMKYYSCPISVFRILNPFED